MSYLFDKTTPLCEIMVKYGSDKGSLDPIYCKHNFTTFYYNIFKDIRYNELRVFELGLGTNDISMPSNMGSEGKPGASLYGWREFFCNSKIFGADIDRKILFKVENINTFYCDQTNPQSITDMWNNHELVDKFDIIIEDGLHEYTANVCFFENSIDKLNTNGFYIIEDIAKDQIHLFYEKIKEWDSKYPYLSFTLLQLPSKQNNIDNNILVVHKFTTFGRESLEAAVKDHPESVPAKVLLDNFHHFQAIHSVLNGEWIRGWGSYMFFGDVYTYQREMLAKQEALFRVGQVSKHILEVGVYVGHSLLILLASNPSLKITCIDIDSRYSPKVVNYLNSQFNNRVTLIIGDALDSMKSLPDNTYDAIHIDADHTIQAVTSQFTEAKRLATVGALFVFDDYEALRPAIDGWISENTLRHILTPGCLYTNIVTNLL